MKKHSLFIILIITLALGIGFWREHQLSSPTVNKMTNTSVLQAGTLLGRSQKLPNFNLTDAKGNIFTQDNLKNHWSFVFFGYSQCPDICPLTLQRLSDIHQRLKQFPQIQYVFITIDPQRDSSAALKNYFEQAKYLHHPFIALTGEKTILDSLTQLIGIHVSEADPTQGNIEHSGTLLLLNPEGKLAAVFANTGAPSAIAQDVKTMMHLFANGQ